VSTPATDPERKRAPAASTRLVNGEPLRLAHTEWLGNGKRPIGELGLWCHQLDQHPVLGQRLERKRGLERSDTRSRDQNMLRLLAPHRRNGSTAAGDGHRDNY
jgi:hypothetical protein